MPFKRHHRKPYEQPPPSPIEVSFWETAKPLIPELQREAWIGKKYRVDFLIPSKKVIIELYGYQHHNTKEKITRDAERERYLQGLGYQVIRFTGSEVYKDAQKCVNEILSLAKIQPTPKVNETVLLELFSQADKRNSHQFQESFTALSSVSYHDNGTIFPPKSPANKVSPSPTKISYPVPPPSISKPIARKKNVLDMETWQVMVLGALLMTFVCILLGFAVIFLNFKTF